MAVPSVRRWYRRTWALLLAPPAVLVLYIALTALLLYGGDWLSRTGHGRLGRLVGLPGAYLFYLAGFPIICLVALELPILVLLFGHWWTGRADRQSLRESPGHEAAGPNSSHRL